MLLSESQLSSPVYSRSTSISYAFSIPKLKRSRLLRTALAASPLHQGCLPASPCHHQGR